MKPGGQKSKSSLWIIIFFLKVSLAKSSSALSIVVCIFGFLILYLGFLFILFLCRAKLASCCDAVQNFVVSQNNTPVGTNMSYEVESKKEIPIKKNIFHMFPVVSKDFWWVIYVTIPGEFSFTLSCNLQLWWNQLKYHIVMLYKIWTMSHFLKGPFWMQCGSVGKDYLYLKW